MVIYRLLNFIPFDICRENKVKIIGFTPQTNEYLNGYLFRVLMAIGFRDLSTVVAQYGGWKPKPLIPNCAHYQFEHLKSTCNILMKVKLVKRSMENRGFSHLVSHRHDISNLFYFQSKFEFPGRVIPIRFCPACIEEQIYEKGFSFFKHEWNLYDNCFKHGASLLELSGMLRYSETIEYIQHILCGRGRGLEVARPSHKVSLKDDEQERLLMYFSLW